MWVQGCLNISINRMVLQYFNDTINKLQLNGLNLSSFVISLGLLLVGPINGQEFLLVLISCAKWFSEASIFDFENSNRLTFDY